jgi:hypothetical protein
MLKVERWWIIYKLALLEAVKLLNGVKRELTKYTRRRPTLKGYGGW